jgi:hypothetical protein
MSTTDPALPEDALAAAALEQTRRSSRSPSPQGSPPTRVNQFAVLGEIGLDEDTVMVEPKGKPKHAVPEC